MNRYESLNIYVIMRVAPTDFDTNNLAKQNFNFDA